MQIVGYLLLVIHFALLFWAAGGFLEMTLPEVFWKPYTNPDFPDWVLVIHWGSVLFAAVTFIIGYLSHWSKTPVMMSVAYGMMAIVCAIETFGYMTSSTKYIAMVTEYITYIAIIFMLFRAPYFQDYFD